MVLQESSMRAGYIALVILVTGLLGCSAQMPRADTATFDTEEIRSAERAVISALESDDPVAWVDHYTEDAVLLESGAPPVQGRPALLEMARAMKPLSQVVINPEHTEGNAKLAFVYGTGSWVNGRPPSVGETTRVRLVMIWRKETNGRWRIAQETFVPHDGKGGS
jgi:ketosteroid isomerase-like protein